VRRHNASGGHNEIAGNMGGEDITEGKEPGEVNHAGDDAQERR
jgi:hypothetical protein